MKSIESLLDGGCMSAMPITHEKVGIRMFGYRSYSCYRCCQEGQRGEMQKE